MDVRLVVKKGAPAKRTMRLKSEETIVGRRQDCDLKIRSAEVSRRHCLLSWQDGVLHVEDLDSVNGTFLNGRRVSGRLVVRPGDQLDIGPISFRVEYSLSREATKRLAQDEAPTGGSDEVDALPVVEDAEDAFNFNTDDDLDALPLADEDTEFGETASEVKDAEEDEVIPVVDDVLDAKEWHLPQSNDLRDLLTQMDEDPKGKRRSKQKE